MSGGSLDYVYSKVADAADSIESRSRNPLHLAFSKHLRKVATALHDLEWVYSCDKCSPDEEAAIRAVLHQADELESAKEEAEISLRHLQAAINSARQIIGNGEHVKQQPQRDTVGATK